jgi:cytoskeletal protein CcmA (bactofilin family)
MDLPVIFLSDVTIDGNGSETTILGDLKVEGNTVLQGGSTQIHSANVTMTGAVNMNDLMVGTSLEVVGPSMFASNIEVMQDAILDRDLTTKGHAHLFDLELDDALDVKGETRLEDSVWLIGDRHELHVDGDVTLEQTLTVNGETDLQDVTVEGQFVFNDQVVFNNDVEMEKLQVQDLTIDGTCVGCV